MEPELTIHPIDVAKAAQNEGDAILERLSHGYVTFGAGDPEAEVIRALIDSVNEFGSILSGFVNQVGAAVDGVAKLFATATPDDDE